MQRIATLEDLEAIYSPAPTLASTAKELPHLVAEYRRYIEASPFVALATSGPEGLDCSPRGDVPGFVRILDDKTLAMPERRGNNRIDSLRNIIRDERVGLLFLIPGSGTTFRVNGRAHLVNDVNFCASFIMEGKAPRSVIIIEIDNCYFQCARAIHRSGLWNPANFVDAASLPSPGEVLDRLTKGDIDGSNYDREWPQRAAKTMW